jgi:hypothetical protein
MKKLASLGVVALVAVLAVLGFSSPAAQAYPDVQIDLSVDRQRLYGGETFTATATSNVDCDWKLSWDGDTRTSSGLKFVTTYTADEVDEVTRIPLRGTCEYDAPTARGSEVWQRTIVITVLPRSVDVAGPMADLPNTGGPDRVFLVGGVVLLFAGATAVTVARRRAEEAEIAASRS